MKVFEPIIEYNDHNSNNNRMKDLCSRFDHVLPLSNIFKKRCKLTLNIPSTLTFQLHNNRVATQLKMGEGNDA